MKINVRSEFRHFEGVLLGVFAWASAYRFFIVPAGLYNGGFTGISQIIRNTILYVSGQNFDLDVTGIIYWCLNIPLFILGKRNIGKMFILRTIIAVSIQSALMVFLPSPPKPIFSDLSLNCIVGGALSGYGIGTILKSGGSSGGTDILGLYFVKKYPEYSVGRLSMTINIFVFAYAAIFFSYETAAYSLVFSLISSMVMDRTHSQNIRLAVFIVSKVPDLGKKLTKELTRGVTSWNGWGEFSGDGYQVHMIVLNKYELHRFRQILSEADPAAFSWVVSPSMVIGNFARRLDV
jgi:uncharacterized membrane-anchored protein YitT (DUF2179 family)